MDSRRSSDDSDSEREDIGSLALSDPASEGEWHVHNCIGLKLQHRITSEQLEKLKEYFRRFDPLMVKECEQIRTFLELWHMLNRYKIIIPGWYSKLIDALDRIGAESCRLFLKKESFEEENHSATKAIRLREEAEKELQAMRIVREKSHLQHVVALDESENDMIAARCALQCEVRELHCERLKNEQLREELLRERAKREELERTLHDLLSQQRSHSSASTREEARRVHHNRGNCISLKLQEVVTAEHVAKLKQYFRNSPLDATDMKEITTFIELWNTLDEYGTIKPGEYSKLKNALAFIGAKSSKELLKKLEKDVQRGQY